MVNKLAFDFKHRVLVSCSDDGTCRVWNLRDVYVVFEREARDFDHSP